MLIVLIRRPLPKEVYEPKRSIDVQTDFKTMDEGTQLDNIEQTVDVKSKSIKYDLPEYYGSYYLRQVQNKPLNHNFYKRQPRIVRSR